MKTGYPALDKVLSNLPPLDMEDTFTIEGSDLNFKMRPYNEDGLWKKAYCVDHGCTYEGFPKDRISILTQGKYGVSPHLELPYFIHFHGNAPGDSISVLSRRKGPGETVDPVIDVRNPYKPVRIDLDPNSLDSNNEICSLVTNYGVLDVYALAMEEKDKVKVYIPKYNVVANLFITANVYFYLHRGSFSSHKVFTKEDGPIGVVLQCMFNVGNAFLRTRAFPVKHDKGYYSRPLVSISYGSFTEDGLWNPEIPKLADTAGEIHFLQNFASFKTGNQND